MIRSRVAGSEAAAVVYPDGLAALGVCRALGRLGVRVIVLATGRTTPGQYSRYARRIACPAGTDDLVDFLVAFGQKQPEPPVLFLTDDAALLALIPHQERLEQWFRFPHPTGTVLERVMLKNHLYRALEGVVPVPRTAVLDETSDLAAVARAIGYPALVKPFVRCLADHPRPTHIPFDKVFGAKAIRVRTWLELQQAHGAARAHGFPTLVQEEIAGPLSSLHSVGLYVARDGALAAAFTSRKVCQVPADFGDGLVVEAMRAPELIPLAARALTHLGYYGMADVEFKWDPRDRVHKLLDINPRPWLWINLPTACGVNLPRAAYLDAVGRPLDPAAFVQRDFETAWVSIRGCLVSLLRSLVEGRAARDVLSSWRSVDGRRVGPLYAADDPLLRMFVSPGYWWASFQMAIGGVRRLGTMRRDRALARRQPTVVTGPVAPEMRR